VPPVSTPRLNVRALADLIPLPSYAQLRILSDQKYPKQQPASFKTAIQALQSLGNKVRTQRNQDALSAFQASKQAGRSLIVRPTTRVQASIQGVDVRVSWDLIAEESGVPRRIFYNMRANPVDSALARTAMELAVWTAAAARGAIPAKELEFIDLASRGKRYVIRTAGRRSIARARSTLKMVAAAWPSI
jgi:hypothetical protein